MDYKKLGTFIVAIGLGLLVYGSVTYVTNRKSVPPPKTSSQFTGWNQFMKAGKEFSGYISKNMKKKENMKKAKKFMFIGGGIMLLGFIVNASAEKK